MYVLEGRSDVVERLRGSMRNRGIRKIFGMSFIYLSGLVYWFSVGDRLYLRMKEIYLKLNEVIEWIRLGGYVFYFFFLEVDLEDKE